MTEQLFEDPRHRLSEQFAREADRAERSGNLDTAVEKYATAASLEEQGALDVPAEAPRVRSQLAISAVALWLRARQWSEAARAGHAFLAHPDLLTPDSCVELQSLVEQARRTSETERPKQ